MTGAPSAPRFGYLRPCWRFLVIFNRSVVASFLAALNQIRGASLPCEYTLPVPTAGTPDYGQVNVELTDNGANTIIPYAGSQAACDPTLGGWTYDVNPGSGTPTRVILCPASCSAVKAKAGAEINIVQGCTTIVL